MDTDALRRLAGQMLAAGLPTLADLIAGLLPVRVPGTAGMVEWALRQAAKQLGLPADAAPAAIADTIAGADPAEVQARLQPLEQQASEAVERIRAEAEVARTSAAEVGQTMRAEVAAGVSWWHWRHLLGYVVGGWIAGVAVASVKVMFAPSPDAIRAVSDMMTAITPILAAASALLGYIAMDTSRRTTAAAAGTVIPTVIGAVAAAAKKGGR